MLDNVPNGWIPSQWMPRAGCRRSAACPHGRAPSETIICLNLMCPILCGSSWNRMVSSSIRNEGRRGGGGVGGLTPHYCTGLWHFVLSKGTQGGSLQDSPYQNVFCKLFQAPIKDHYNKTWTFWWHIIVGLWRHESIMIGCAPGLCWARLKVSDRNPPPKCYPISHTGLKLTLNLPLFQCWLGWRKCQAINVPEYCRYHR